MFTGIGFAGEGRYFELVRISDSDLIIFVVKGIFCVAEITRPLSAAVLAIRWIFDEISYFEFRRTLIS